MELELLQARPLLTLTACSPLFSLKARADILVTSACPSLQSPTASAASRTLRRITSARRTACASQKSQKILNSGEPLGETWVRTVNRPTEEPLLPFLRTLGTVRGRLGRTRLLRPCSDLGCIGPRQQPCTFQARSHESAPASSPPGNFNAHVCVGHPAPSPFGGSHSKEIARAPFTRRRVIDARPAQRLLPRRVLHSMLVRRRGGDSGHRQRDRSAASARRLRATAATGLRLAAWLLDTSKRPVGLDRRTVGARTSRRCLVARALGPAARWIVAIDPRPVGSRGTDAASSAAESASTAAGLLSPAKPLHWPSCCSQNWSCCR